MKSNEENLFSGPVTVFQGRYLPVTATPTGYAALIGAYGLRVPLPRTLSATGERHRIQEEGGWRIYSPRHAPEASLEGHLTFALKYEGLDLAVLKSLFVATGPSPIAALVRARPTGSYARRSWFLYEWLTGTRLDLPNADRGVYALIVDPDRQFAARGETSSRHRVKNNLPGTPAFCPMVHRTETLNRFIAMDLCSRAQDAAAAVPSDLLSRTAAFLLLKDSRASFAIEGEHPSPDRIQRWGRALGQAGQRPIVAGLVDGMTAFDRQAARHLDPVVAAAILAFGFVYVHPLVDGNGRLHRYLVHHALARHGFGPPDIVFPVSAAILDRIDEYRIALEAYSKRLLPVIDWKPTEKGNVRVLRDTSDFYRFFDATPQTEFLYGCVQRTIEQDLPEQAGFLKRHDAFRSELRLIVDMPEQLSNLLFRLLHQNGGILSRRARRREFAALTDEEASRLEAIYRDVFANSEH